MSKSLDKSAILADLRATFGDTVDRAQIAKYERDHGLNARSVVSFVRVLCPRVGRGEYSLNGSTPVVPMSKRMSPKPAAPAALIPTASPSPSMAMAAPTVTANTSSNLAFSVSQVTDKNDIAAMIARLSKEASALSSIPDKSKAFVPFGEYDTIRTIISSGVFCPMFITGHSGNGKTFGVQQACAAEQREYIRVNITAETDEDDLIGGFRLKNGDTVFELGPVVVAMLRGAVLMLDEIDLAGAKIMCLQPVLEGQPLLIKKLGVTIHPTAGFTIFATANTKGRGSDDGKYIGTNLLNEAFLERFNATIEQDYPGVAVEKKILAKTFEVLGGTMDDKSTVFFETLAQWADAIRATFKEGGIEDLVTTRRLCHIVKLYGVFGDANRALTLALNRFDKEVQMKFLDFYAKLDPTNAAPAAAPDATTATVIAPPANF